MKQEQANRPDKKGPCRRDFRQGLCFRPLTSGTQRPVYSTATPRANVRNASNSAGEIASG